MFQLLKKDVFNNTFNIQQDIVTFFDTLFLKFVLHKNIYQFIITICYGHIQVIFFAMKVQFYTSNSIMKSSLEKYVLPTTLITKFPLFFLI